MVEMSKLYREPLNRIACATYLHPGQSCAEFLLKYGWELFLLASKYYLPVLIIPLFLQRKRISQKLLLDIFKLYGGAVICAAGTMICSVGLVCFSRRIMGKLCVPISLSIYAGMHLAWFFPERVFRTFATYTLQVALHVMLRENAQKFLFCRLVLNSMPLKTLLFMLTSGIVLHFKKVGLYRGFWFINPITSTTTSNTNWFKRFITNLKSSLCYGLTIDLLREALKKTNLMRKGTLSLKQSLYETIKSLRFSMVSFIVVYETFYHLTQWLCSKYIPTNEKNQNSKNIQHYFAAFLGGVGFICVDNVMLLLFAMVSAVQLLWAHFGQYVTRTKKHWLLRTLVDLPIARILFPFKAAYIVHNYLHSLESMGSIGKIFVDTLTNNRIKLVKERIRSNGVQELLQMSLREQHRGFFL